MTDEEFLEEYAKLGHAIQTGVAYEMEYGSKDTQPKHLRTGFNCVMSDLGSMGRLLIAKGIITEAEYFEAMLDGLRREVATYEDRLNERLSGATKITLR